MFFQIALESSPLSAVKMLPHFMFLCHIVISPLADYQLAEQNEGAEKLLRPRM